jgi:leader peptidase (prepilin peptidase) / N-methyltransferase
MELLVYFIVFLLGCAVGSFLNVVVDRSNEGKSFVKGRSHCDHCRHKLHWFDLIPIVSFLLLWGKCRYCQATLSLYYPVVEIVTGLAFVLIAVFYSPSLLAMSYFFFIISCLIVIFFVDLKFGIIPFFSVIPAVVLTFIFYLFVPGNIPLSNYLLSGLGAFLFFFLLFAITKGKGMGFGDVVYAFLMGFLLGFPKVVLGFYIAFITGALISLFLVWLHKKKLKGSTIPFGPFLVAATVISMFWGDQLIEKALQFLVR